MITSKFEIRSISRCTSDFKNQICVSGIGIGLTFLKIPAPNCSKYHNVTVIEMRETIMATDESEILLEFQFDI